MNIENGSKFLVLKKAIPSSAIRMFLHKHVDKNNWFSIMDDQKRCQQPLETELPFVQFVKSVLKKTPFALNREFGSCVLIKSWPNGATQQYHTDFDPEQVLHSDLKPLSVIIPMSRTCRLHYKGSPLRTQINHLVLNQGDLLIFHGDFVHAGAAYKTYNYRFHMYWNVVNVPEPHNLTYPEHGADTNGGTSDRNTKSPSTRT